MLEGQVRADLSRAGSAAVPDLHRPGGAGGWVGGGWGIELNAEYVELSRNRLEGDAGLFAEVSVCSEPAGRAGREG